jgi:hypothetical protein
MPAFTYEDIRSIEGTVEKLVLITQQLSPASSEDRKNVAALSYIVSNLRNATDLMRSDSVDIRTAGFEKLLALFNNKEFTA